MVADKPRPLLQNSLVVRLSDMSSKKDKNVFFVFLGCFWAYVGQPHYHINLNWFSWEWSNFFFFKKNAFLACFRAYVGQPHGHIRWATSMPFASINSTNPTTNLNNFREKMLRIGDFENLSFFESAILICFSKKKIFLHSHENQFKFIW